MAVSVGEEGTSRREERRGGVGRRGASVVDVEAFETFEGKVTCFPADLTESRAATGAKLRGSTTSGSGGTTDSSGMNNGGRELRVILQTEFM